MCVCACARARVIRPAFRGSAALELVWGGEGFGSREFVLLPMRVAELFLAVCSRRADAISKHTQNLGLSGLGLLLTAALGSLRATQKLS